MVIITCTHVIVQLNLKIQKKGLGRLATLASRSVGLPPPQGLGRLATLASCRVGLPPPQGLGRLAAAGLVPWLACRRPRVRQARHAGLVPRRLAAAHSNSKRVAPKRLSRRVRSRKGSRPTVSSTVSLRDCAEEVAPKGAFPQGFAPDGLLNGLPTGCRFAAVGLRAAVGLPLPRDSRLAADGRRAAVGLPLPIHIQIAQCLCSKLAFVYPHESR